MLKTAIIVVAMLAFSTVAFAQTATPDTNSWNWQLTPSLGAGSTLTKGFQTTVSLGLQFGTFPQKIPVLGGRDFGALIGKAGGQTCGGPWVNLLGPIDIALLGWRGAERPTGDIALIIRKGFSF